MGQIRKAVVQQGGAPLILADPYLSTSELYSYAEALEKVAMQLFDECAIMNEGVRHLDKTFESYREKNKEQIQRFESENAELKQTIKDLLDFKYGSILSAKELIK